MSILPFYKTTSSVKVKHMKAPINTALSKLVLKIFLKSDLLQGKTVLSVNVSTVFDQQRAPLCSPSHLILLPNFLPH